MRCSESSAREAWSPRSRTRSRLARMSSARFGDSSRTSRSAPDCPSRRNSASSTTLLRTRSQQGCGRDSSYVGVTTGLLRTMPKRELEAVIAHEVSHIRNRDTYLMTMATVFAGVIALIADIGFRSIAYGGRSRRGGAIFVILAIAGLPARTVRGPPAADEPLEAPRVPGRRRCSGDPQRSGGDGARAAEAGGRHDVGPVRGRFDSAPVGREPNRSRRLGASRGHCIVRALQHAPPPAARIAALEEAGGFRLPERLSPDEPFAVELGLS